MQISIEWRTGYYDFASNNSKFYACRDVEAEIKSYKVSNGYLKIVDMKGDITYYPDASIIRFTVTK